MKTKADIIRESGVPHEEIKTVTQVDPADLKGLPWVGIRLEDGKTYKRVDGSKHTVGGATKDHPEFVYTIQGDWYERSTGRYITYRRTTGEYAPISSEHWRNLIEVAE